MANKHYLWPIQDQRILSSSSSTYLIALSFHRPLMKEKLELEENMMAKIQETKDNLLQESEMTAERLRITTDKHEEANKKTNSERNHIKRDLEKANKALSIVQ